jgi:hypothetical protein
MLKISDIPFSVANKRIYWYAGLHRFVHSSKHKNEYLTSLKNNDRSQKLESA